MKNTTSTISNSWILSLLFMINSACRILHKSMLLAQTLRKRKRKRKVVASLLDSAVRLEQTE